MSIYPIAVVLILLVVSSNYRAEAQAECPDMSPWSAYFSIYRMAGRGIRNIISPRSSSQEMKKAMCMLRPCDGMGKDIKTRLGCAAGIASLAMKQKMMNTGMGKIFKN